MSTELIVVLTLNGALVGMMFKVMVDVGALRERMARLEGLFEGSAVRLNQEGG